LLLSRQLKRRQKVFSFLRSFNK